MSLVVVDVGSSRVKGVRFDKEWGEADIARRATPNPSAMTNRREQDMDQVWSDVEDVLREVVSRSPDPVDALAVTGQGDGCWLVDAVGRPVGHALLWNDNRADSSSAAWRRDGTLERAFRRSGHVGPPGVAHAQLSWLREHEPERLVRAKSLLSCGSWVFANLTRRRVVERSDAANPFCAAASGKYDEDLIDLFGLADLAHLLPPIVSGADAVAPLVPEVAQRVGLPAGTPVVLGPYDVVAAALGAGVSRPGSALAILGTTLCVGLACEDPMLDRAMSGMSLPLLDDRWLVTWATLTGTEALDWATELLGLPSVPALVALAETSTSEAPPLFCPYLSVAGEHAPFHDPGVRGQLRGLTLDHRPADIAHAVVEGVALAVADLADSALPLDALPLDALPLDAGPLEAGPIEHLELAGGGARSELWCQLVADATGAVVRLPPRTEVSAFGAGLVAATAMKHFESVTAAQEETRLPGRTLAPRASSTERLRERLEVVRRVR